MSLYGSHLTRLNVQTVYLHFIECKDYNNFCGTWAARGDCEHNPGYMLKYCKESCLQCGKLLLQYSQRQDIHNNSKFDRISISILPRNIMYFS